MSTAADSVAFLCLGTMGYPMAGHLAQAGHRIRVYNRTSERAHAWLAEYVGRVGGDGAAVNTFAATPADAVADVDAVFVCAGNDDDLREVLLGEGGALPAMRKGSCLIDHTTVSPGLARELAADAQERGIDFLDAPVSGGQAGAETGKLTIMVGGDESVYEKAGSWLDCYAAKRLWMGSAGSGQLTKAVNQICIAGLVQALSEGVRFAQRAGLDPSRVVEVISQGAAGSWQMNNRASTMIEGKFDFGFAVNWMRKDLGIAMQEAREIGASLPVTALVDQLYAQVQAQGGGRLDTSSLFTLLE